MPITRLRVLCAAAIVIAILILIAAGDQQLAGQSGGAAHRAETAARQSHDALADFEAESLGRRRDNAARLKHDEALAAANRREALRRAELSRRLAVVARSRADDAARAAMAQAALSAANRRAISALTVAQRQIRALQAELATTLSRSLVLSCVRLRASEHTIIVTLAGPHPPAQIHGILRVIDEQRCAHA